MNGYDLERLTPGGAKVTHHDGRIETDGPWLMLGEPDAPAGVYPAHAVVSLEPCEGRCRNGGE